MGNVSKRSADTAFRHVSELIAANTAGGRPDAQTEKWARGLTGRIRQRLVELGLIDAANPMLGTDAGRLLGPYLDAYILGRTDCKPGTIENFKHARRLLVELFGERKPLVTITMADADRWQRWLQTDKGHAEATISKHIKRAKTMFTAAVKDRLLNASPFNELKGGNEANSTRHFEVTPAITADVLDACPDDDWRLIFGLARFCGLRCPSEVLTLKWTDILWDKSKLRIDSPKTGLRFCPLFPELMPILLQAAENAPDGAKFCIQRYRAGYNTGPTMARIIENAGHEPWPKVFINLRSTRRTELERSYPNHVVNKWLGHSAKTAEKHYLQVTDSDWSDGATKQTNTLPEPRAHAGGNTPANTQEHGVETESKKPKKSAICASTGLPILSSATPLGLEPRMAGPKPAVLPITPRGSAPGKCSKCLSGTKEDILSKFEVR